MTLNKELLYGYGLDLQPFLDTGPIHRTMQRTINPDEECLFYIVVLTEGVVRAELVFKDHDLFYSITPQLDLALIPCGHVMAKK